MRLPLSCRLLLLSLLGAACSPGADDGGEAGATGGASASDAAGQSGGAATLAPIDTPAWAADPEDEGPAATPAASGPLGFDVAACGLDAGAPADACPTPDVARPLPAGAVPVAAPVGGCEVADGRCQEPDHCAPGTDPDCVPLGPAGDPDCGVPDGICDEGVICAAGTDPDCADEDDDGVPAADADPLCATPDGFCDEPEPCATGTDPDCVDCAEPDGICDEDSLCDPDTDPDCQPDPEPAPGVDAPSPPDAPPVCDAPAPGPGTCTVVCCDDTRFVMEAPDAQTCQAQWRQCREHRKTVAISFSQPACENVVPLYQRTEPCLECCATCVGARREKFVDTGFQCTEAAMAFCAEDGRGGLLEARWGVCGGPEADAEDAAGLTEATFDVESEDDQVVPDVSPDSPKQAVCAVTPPDETDDSNFIEVVFNDVANARKSTAIRDRYKALLRGAAPDAELRLAMFQIHEDDYVAALDEARKTGDLRVVKDGKAKNQRNTPLAALKAAVGEDKLTICSNGGCIGDKINHNKFLLVSELANEGGKHIVAHGSQNFVESQDHRFNHLVIVRDQKRLYDHFEAYWQALRRQTRTLYQQTRKWRRDDGTVTAFFFPRADDPVAKAIRGVDCGSPENPSTIRVHVAFFNKDRRAVYHALRRKRNAGCRVDVLMGTFHGGTLPSPKVMRALRRTNQKVFCRQSRHVTSHSKYMLIDEGGRKTVYAGSHNYTRDSLRRNDEAMLRIRNAAVYDAFACDMDRAFTHVDAQSPCGPGEACTRATMCDEETVE